MLRLYFIVLVLVFICKVSFSQIVIPAWVDSVPGHHGSGFELAKGYDGYIYAAGSISLNAAFQKRIALIKLDKAGNRIWKFMSDTLVSSGLQGEAHALTIGKDGYLYLAGTKAFTVGATQDMFLMKLDTAGQLIWERSYSGPGPQNNFDIANDVAVDDSGNVFITSSYCNQGSDEYFFTLKYGAQTTGLPEFSDIKSFHLFPNPSNTSINIQWYQSQNGIVSFHVYDLLGKEISKAHQSIYFNAGQNKFSFDSNTFNNGIYIFELSNDKIKFNKQFVVSR